MTVISIINTKGGVGKTTASVYLATAFANQGYSVALIDTDPQGSAFNWASDAKEAGEQLPFSLILSNAEHITGHLAGLAPDTIAVIDTPPRDEDIIAAVADQSDFIVVPMKASPQDIRRTWETLDIIGDAAPHAVLLNETRANTKILATTQEVLEEGGVDQFRGPIPRRESFLQEVGEVPKTMHGYNAIAKEIMEKIK